MEGSTMGGLSRSGGERSALMCTASVSALLGEVAAGRAATQRVTPFLKGERERARVRLMEWGSPSIWRTGESVDVAEAG